MRFFNCVYLVYSVIDFVDKTHQWSGYVNTPIRNANGTITLETPYAGNPWNYQTGMSSMKRIPDPPVNTLLQYVSAFRLVCFGCVYTPLPSVFVAPAVTCGCLASRPSFDRAWWRAVLFRWAVLMRAHTTGIPMFNIGTSYLATGWPNPSLDWQWYFSPRMTSGDPCTVDQNNMIYIYVRVTLLSSSVCL